MLLTPTEDNLIAEMRARLAAPLPPVLGVAVSGGSDSLALLYLLAAMAREEGSALHVVTVDHGLRAESRGEAEEVARHAAALGLTHDILTWQDPPAGGNLQAEARAARYRLMAEWSHARGAAGVAVGHTADDQAETVLMRLRRASGVAGLSAMPVRHWRAGIEILRPLLSLRRADLRAYLTARNIDWLEDPSNRDTRFERVRVRGAMAALESIGLTVEALTTVADNMRRADEALNEATLAAASEIGAISHGAVRLERAGFFALNPELARRLLLSALTYVRGTAYPPRGEALQAVLAELRAGRGATLHGCQLLLRGAALWVCREVQALRAQRLLWTPDATERIWDASWCFKCDAVSADPGAFELRVVGEEGLAQLPDWRAAGVPREVLLALPGLWRGGGLAVVPEVKSAPGWRCAALRQPAAWALGTLSH